MTAYALGQAIRGGQERGESRAQGAGSKDSQLPVDNRKLSPYEFATPDELTRNGAGIHLLTDDVSDADFEVALDQAQDEQNVSRARLIRVMA